MIRVVILGYGNVGFHLHKAMTASLGVDVVQVYNRNRIDNLATAQTQKLTELVEADVYIMAIPDNAIASFSEVLPLSNKLVVHTSGGAAMNQLSSGNRKGVFYLLQTFSKETEVDFNNIPICVEAENVNDTALLKKLGECISENVVEINSDKRAILHLAAVFVNNFVNHLYGIASEISEENNIDFNLLKPLITETANKLSTLSPSDAQTGPAKRNDTKTIEKHLHLLEDNKYAEIYELLTQSIYANQKKQD